MPKGDRGILKADPEDGTTPIANLLLEAVAIAKLTGKEKGAILFLCRRTYGWGVGLNRLKEAQIPLSSWASILNGDISKASTVLSGLVKKQIFKREFAGPGRGYTYSLNTRVAEWGNGCLNRQLLSELGRQQLPKTTRQQLLKMTTPVATNLATGKSILNRFKNNSNIDQEKKGGKTSEGFSGQSIERMTLVVEGKIEAPLRVRKSFEKELDKRGVVYKKQSEEVKHET